MSTTTEAIIRWWETNADEGHRPHLGASLIGTECERALWLTFRWAKAQKWEGRMLRLFNAGQRAEARLVEELRGIGLKVWETDEAGQQFRVSAHAGHFGGSVDAVATGVLENPAAPHVVEFKTSNDKAFKELVKKAVAEAKPMHYAQMQCYMGLLELSDALYLVENKNDAAIYSELVAFDKAAFDKIMAKALRIIEATEPPPKIGGADDFACKWCNFADVCHGSQAAEVNCRTCTHATPDLQRTEGAWTCSAGTGRGLFVIPIAHQRTGCDQHLYIPPLLRNVGEPVDGGEAHVVYRTADGLEFVNGPGKFSSKEIYECKHKALLTDPVVQDVKELVPAARLINAGVFDDMPSDDVDAVPAKPVSAKVKKERAAVKRSVDQLKSSEVPF
jgi:hypothetical protein